MGGGVLSILSASWDGKGRGGMLAVLLGVKWERELLGCVVDVVFVVAL
jgi:hypothetical protein